MEHSTILEVLEVYHQNINDDNVVAIGYGYKVTNNLLTDEKSIVFTVKQKLSIDQLTNDQLLPSSILLPDDTSINTDVIQGEYIISTCDPNFYNWQTITPINQDLNIPLQGGTNVTETTFEVYTGTGTLGMLAIDNETNSIVAVSAGHVFSQNLFICSNRINYGPAFTENTASNVTLTKDTSTSSANIGLVKRYYPLYNSATNYIDAALSTIEDTGIVSLTESYKQLGLSPTTLPFATTVEIDALLITNPLLYSSGRTTGPKGEDITKLRMYQSPIVASVYGYWAEGVKQSVTFSDCFSFVAVESDVTPVPPSGTTGLCIYPSYAGDSGSAVIADIGGTRKIIGLLFAGGAYNTIVCRIDRIASMLNISAWNGETINYSDPALTLSHTVAGLSNDVYLDIVGKRYWQVGTTQV